MKMFGHTLIRNFDWWSILFEILLAGASNRADQKPPRRNGKACFAAKGRKRQVQAPLKVSKLTKRFGRQSLARSIYRLANV